MGKNEKKRKKRKKLNTMSASERQQWQTGYSDPKLIRAAMNNHSGGAQKGERDRLKWDGQIHGDPFKAASRNLAALEDRYRHELMDDDERQELRDAIKRLHG